MLRYKCFIIGVALYYYVETLVPEYDKWTLKKATGSLVNVQFKGLVFPSNFHLSVPYLPRTINRFLLVRQHVFVYPELTSIFTTFVKSRIYATVRLVCSL